MSAKYSLHLEGLTLEELAKVVLALKGSTTAVIGSGAATPQAAPTPTQAAAYAPSTAAPAPTHAPAPAPTHAPAPAVTATATSPSDGGALTYKDVTTTFTAALARIKAAGVQSVNAQFGISSPLALKERPQDWAGYIAALNDAPAPAAA